MKLHQPSEPRERRPKAHEVLGMETPELGTVFDPEQDVPTAFRKLWLESINSNEPDADVIQEEAFAFEFLATFPERRAELDLNRLRERIFPGDFAIHNYIELVALFPERLQEISANFKTKYALKPPPMGFLSEAELAKAWASTRVLAPELAVQYEELMQQDWEKITTIFKRNSSETAEWAILKMLKIASSARFMFPNRFSELELTAEQLMAAERLVRKKFAEASTDNFPLGMVLPVGQLAVLTADEVKAEPLQPIQIIRYPRRLGQGVHLPERPQV